MAVWFLTSGIVMAAVILLRAMLKNRIGIRMRYALWLIVVLRLLFPFHIGESTFSGENLYRELPKWSMTLEETIRFEVETAGMTDEQIKAKRFLEADDLNPRTNTMEKLSSFRIDDFPRLARTVWLIGCIAVGGVFLAANLRFSLRLRRSRTRLDEADTPVPVYVSGAVNSPCLFGFPRPAIYLTTETAGDDAVKPYILAHETAHYRSGDHLFGFLRCVCVTLHWFNPLVWLCAALSKRDCELACDARALRILGESEAAAYGRVLLALSCNRRRQGLFSASADAAGQSESLLAERIRALVQKREVRTAAQMFVLLLAAVLAVIGFTGVHTDRIAADVAAPEYVKTAALAWAEEEINRSWEAFSDVLESFGKTPPESYRTTDWQISKLRPMGMTAPVCGREIEIWCMELREYSDAERGEIMSHWSYTSDGSGWVTKRDTYYLVFDAADKSLIWKFLNRMEMDERELWERIIFEMRVYENPYLSYDESVKRNIAGMNLQTIWYMLNGQTSHGARTYHYVDGVCYKLEPVSETTGKYGKEEIHRVIVNNTGEELGKVIYYPEHDDIAMLDEEGKPVV
ncbi:MAG: M56 family metallopeptidase [Clostridia bacterium]|nr:M56 family metallopeptidase [Clostridia bacterium]